MNESRRTLLKSAGAALVVGTAMRRVLDAAVFDPLEKSIRELQRAMAAGQLSSAPGVVTWIAAADQWDARERRHRAEPHAGTSARELDEAQEEGARAGRCTSPFF
jgi:hypothetical protein